MMTGKETMDQVHEQNRNMFYDMQEAITTEDAKAAAKQRDFEAVEDIYQAYGEFLNRHPDALTRLRVPAPPKRSTRSRKDGK